MGNLAELHNSLKRNPDNQFFQNLIRLLEFRLDTVKKQLIQEVNDDAVKRLQGRGLELQETITALTRKPIKSQSTGGFGQ